MNFARLGNKYLAETEPWKLAKTDMSRVETIMNIALQITANLTIVFAPFLPIKAAKIAEFLNCGKLAWENAGSADLLPSGHSLNENKPSILISKIEDSFVEAQVAKLEASKLEKAAGDKVEQPIIHADQKTETSFDDFMKMDIRVGEILEAEKVKKSDKLLKLLVDTGLDKRIVVSGIAEHFAPEDVIGKKVSVLMNLAPRKIRGVESQGMILMAENAEGKLSFVSPDESFSTGCEIR